jgi:hypothetical protein
MTWSVTFAVRNARSTQFSTMGSAERLKRARNGFELFIYLITLFQTSQKIQITLSISPSQDKYVLD